MAKESKSTIMVATISAASAVVNALITTYGTIAVSAPEAKRVKNDLKEISPKVEKLSKTLEKLDADRMNTELKNLVKDAIETSKKLANLQKLEFPIGTIIASMLQPSMFADAVGDPSVFDQKISKWALAVGRDGEDIAMSKYGVMLDKTYTPDLRGMFLRGMNVKGVGADPNKNREVGSSQKDAFAEHNHKCPVTYYDRPPGLIGSNQNGDTTAFKFKKLEPNDPKYNESEYYKYDNRREQTDETGTADETRPKNVAVYFYIKIN